MSSRTPKPGDRLTDWHIDQTFTVARVGRHSSGHVVADTTGQIRRVVDTVGPGAEHDRAFNEGELLTMVSAIEEELCGDTSSLLAWLALLSPVQKAQVWGRLHPQAKEELKRLREAAGVLPTIQAGQVNCQVENKLIEVN